jgi:hypothetical protein
MRISERFRSNWVVALLGVPFLLTGLEAGLCLFGNRPDFIPLEPALARLRVPHSTRGIAYRTGFSTYLIHVYGGLANRGLVAEMAADRIENLDIPPLMNE